MRTLYFTKKEVLIAGFFGLIHGLAFSLTLSGISLNIGGKLLSVLGFNLGIEAMQMVVMLGFLCIFTVK